MIGSMTWKNSRLTRFARLIILSATLAVASGCCGAKPILESVIVKDTVVITKERKLVDTLTLFKDTVIYQDRVKLKIEYIDNFVKLEADCPTDTIVVTQVKVSTSKQEGTKKLGWESLLGWLITIVCLIIIVKQIAKKLI